MDLTHMYHHNDDHPPPPTTAPKQEHVSLQPQILIPPKDEDPMYKYPNHMSNTPRINPLPDLASMEAFSSFTNQSAILRVDTDNEQTQMDLSDM